MSELRKSLEEIINSLWLETTDKSEACRRMREVLAGYRILAPGEMDRETLEAAAKVAQSRHEQWRMPHPDDALEGEVCCDVSACNDIAAAIRALGGGNG